MITVNSRSTAESREAGFTLVELLVYAMLLSVALTIVGGILISTMQVQHDVRTKAEATTLGQSVVRSVQAGVRNASFVTLTDVGGAQLLLIRTAGAGDNLEWACQAWFYSPDQRGSLYMKRAQPAAPIAAPDPGELTSWTLLANGVSADDEAIFSAIAGRVTIDLKMVVDDHPAISIRSTAAMRLLPTTISPCEVTP